MKKRILFGILISVFFLYFVLRNIDLKNILEIISNGKYWWVLPTLLTTTLGFLFRSIRWKYLFLPIKDIKPEQLFSSLIMGFAANNIFPMRFGEFVRAYIVGKKHNVSKSASFATIVFERIMDGVGILILVSISLIFLPKFPPWTKRAMFFSILFFVGTLVVAGILIIKKHFIDLLMKIPCIKCELKEKIINKIKRFITGFEIIKDIKVFFTVILFSLCVWTCETLTMFFFMKVVGVHLSIFVVIFIVFATVIGVTIPAAPGSIGTFEFFFVASMMFFGVSKGKALASALIIHSIGIIYVILLGGYFFLKEGISYKEIATAD
ncbi:MAG: lysylphosphatidylglycerol synthase transmembrane domain-containing protein [Elusimicrobia bacterium]|nr:lysylphosphatidylglycerol synthase transmembrane domain-containing protein [Elusimicrobiota bacterium]